jgi:CMP/dCMP kinase
MTGSGLFECVEGVGPMCVQPYKFLALAVLLSVIILAGRTLARRNPKRYLSLLKRGFLFALSTIGAGLFAVGLLLLTDADALSGIETSPAAQTAGILAISLLGMGASLLLGVAVYALGGWVAGVSKRPRPNQLVIAIDGPAASGKGTLAKRVSKHFDLPCLDTGLLYRAVARDVIANGGALDNVADAVAAAKALKADSLDDAALRGPAAGDRASMVAKIPAVRDALLSYQRTFAAQPGGAVLDGRDIGTVVCPNATVKLYVTASTEERARRRHLEHRQRGETITFETVLDDLKRRDARDSGRDIAPMKAASDAITIDTTSLNADAAFEAAVDAVTRHFG